MSAKLLEALGANHHVRSAGEERRVSPRKVVSLSARVELPDNTVLDGQTVDLSHTGIGLYSPQLLLTDQECKLTIDLSVCGETLELKLIGCVCYCKEQAQGRYRAGMRFTRIESSAEKLLNQLLS